MEFQSRLGEDAVPREQSGEGAGVREKADHLTTAATAVMKPVQEKRVACAVSLVPDARLPELEAPRRALHLRVLLVVLLRRQPEQLAQVLAAELRRAAAEPEPDDATAQGCPLR
jgi:hypothetical protein